jgi:hypothetical protein
MTAPTGDGISQPLLEDFHIIGVIALQRSPFDDPLRRLRHVEPGTRVGRRKQKNALLSTPLDDAVAFMAGQIVPD